MKTEKPWGSEEVLEKNENYVVKKLYMKAGHRCSLQYHDFKHESFYVLSGKLKFSVGPTVDLLEEMTLEQNSFYVIPPKMIHRMEAIEDSLYLESSTPQLDDVIRIQDSYGRAP